MNISPRLLLSEPIQRCQLGECKAACCLYGVWLDEHEIKDLIANAAIIQPFITSGVLNPLDWFDDRMDEDPFSLSKRVQHSLVVEDETHYGGSVCVFLRKDHKCALQVAADQNGMHAWRFKPFYCILHPLDLDENGLITLDQTAELLTEPASCLRQADHPIPLIETFEPELRYFLGEIRYQQLQQQMKKFYR